MKIRPIDEISDDEIRDIANEAYGCDDVNIDIDAEVNIGEDGAWVAAWVFVSNATLNAESE